MQIDSNQETTAGWTPLVYNELKRLARNHLRREREGHTLNATGLVHEAWIRLANQRHGRFANRSHFFGAVSHTMRRVLVDHARARIAGKRHGIRVTLTSVDVADGGSASDEHLLLLALDAALEKLATVDERLVRVVECRYFAGLTIHETAEAIGVSHATVSDDWRFARAWLRRALAVGSPHTDPEIA